VTVVPVGATCPGGNDGSIGISLFSGSPPYTYRWAGDSLPEQPSLDGLPGGNYSYTVTSTNGCATSGMTVVDAGIPLLLACHTSGATSGPGQSDGEISVSLTDGMAPFEVTFSGADAGAMTFQTAMGELTGLPAGDYTLVATDANGCVSEPCLTTIFDLVPMNCSAKYVITPMGQPYSVLFPLRLGEGSHLSTSSSLTETVAAPPS